MNDATPFEHEWAVRFSDTDPFGIAHYPRIVDAVHETSDAFVESVGFPFWELSQEHGIGLPIVQVDLSFERPVRAGDRVNIALDTEVGESGVRFEYTARRDGEVVFSGYEQRVCVPVDGDGGVPIPDDLRTALEG